MKDIAQKVKDLIKQKEEAKSISDLSKELDEDLEAQEDQEAPKAPEAAPEAPPEAPKPAPKPAKKVILEGEGEIEVKEPPAKPAAPDLSPIEEEVKEPAGAPELPKTIPQDYSSIIEKTGAQIMNVANFMRRAGLIPSSFDTDEKAALGIQTAMSLGFRTVGQASSAMRRMYVISGSISIWGELPLALVRRSGLLDGIKEFFVDKNQKEISLENKNIFEPPEAFVCRVLRRGDKEWQTHFLTAADLIASGIERVGNKFTDKKKMNLWGKYTKAMWTYRVRNFLLKRVFPDALLGVPMYEPGVISEKEEGKRKSLENFVQED